MYKNIQGKLCSKDFSNVDTDAQGVHGETHGFRAFSAPELYVAAANRPVPMAATRRMGTKTIASFPNHCVVYKTSPPRLHLVQHNILQGKDVLHLGNGMHFDTFVQYLHCERRVHPRNKKDAYICFKCRV